MGDIMTAEYKKNFLLNVLFIASVFGITILVSRFMFAYLFPFIIGVAVALAVQKPAAAVSVRFRLSKSISAVVFTVILCLTFFAVLTTSVWVIGNKLAGIITLMPTYMSDLQKVFTGIKDDIIGSMQSLGAEQKNMVENLFSTWVNSALSLAVQFVSSLAASLIKTLPTFLVSSIVTVVASCYIAKDFDRLKKFVLGVLPYEKSKKIIEIKSVMLENGIKFIKGYAIISVITFLQLYAAFFLLGINNPAAVAFAVVLVDILPVLGVGTVLLPWAVIEILLQNVNLGLGLLAAYVVIAIVRNFIEPKIIGSQIGINPIFTLLSMFLGLKTAGVSGMIFFPLALTVVVSYYKKMLVDEGSNRNTGL